MGPAGGCSVVGCTEPYSANGYCKAHAQRVRKYGHPKSDIPLKKQGAPQAFVRDALASATGNCILWPFARNDKGYGQLGQGGKVVYAHREICRRKHGEPPTPEHEVSHSCGRGHEGCINPAHVSWKTHAANQLDRIEHGTSNRGVAHGMAKLTIGKVREIRRLEGSASHAKIGERFGVAPETVRKIIRRQNWKWLDA